MTLVEKITGGSSCVAACLLLGWAGYTLVQRTVGPRPFYPCRMTTAGISDCVIPQGVQITIYPKSDKGTLYFNHILVRSDGVHMSVIVKEPGK